MSKDKKLLLPASGGSYTERNGKLVLASDPMTQPHPGKTARVAQAAKPTGSNTISAAVRKTGEGE